MPASDSSASRGETGSPKRTVALGANNNFGADCHYAAAAGADFRAPRGSGRQSL